MIAEKVRQGLPLEDVYIFDMHGHLGKNYQMMYLDTDAASMVKTMDRVGVDSICLSAMEAFCGDPWRGNDAVVDAIRQFPGRIYGYFSPNPSYPELDFASYFAKEPGMVGFKIHAMLNHAEIDDPRYFPCYEYAHQKGMPVLIHTWDIYEIRQVARMAERFKGCPFLIAHSGMRTYDVRLEVIDTVKRLENVYVDTAISVCYDGAIEWIAGQIGVDRLLYGSDLPFYDCRQVAGKLAMSNLSDPDKRKVFGETAKKLFHI